MAAPAWQNEIIDMAGSSGAFFAPLRTFLIDFDVEQRDRMERDLRSAGFLDIVALPNVATALYLLNMLGCDLVIVEFGADCLRLLQLLAHERHIDTFVIAMASAGPMPEIRLERPVGVDVLLHKPVARSDLMEAIAAFRSSRQSRNLPYPQPELLGGDAAPA